MIGKPVDPNGGGRVGGGEGGEAGGAAGSGIAGGERRRGIASA